jgi:hypothetical protein
MFNEDDNIICCSCMRCFFLCKCIIHMYLLDILIIDQIRDLHGYRINQYDP